MGVPRFLTLLPHAVRYYALTRADLGAHQFWPASVIDHPATIAPWARSLDVRASFVFAKWRFPATAIRHPVSPCPIVTAVCASCLHYFDLSTYEGVWMIVIMDGDGIMYALSLLHRVTGEPKPNTLLAILLVYLFAICGVPSACGMAFPIWRCVVCIINAGVYVFPTRPIWV